MFLLFLDGFPMKPARPAGKQSMAQHMVVASSKLDGLMSSDADSESPVVFLDQTSVEISNCELMSLIWSKNTTGYPTVGYITLSSMKLTANFKKSVPVNWWFCISDEPGVDLHHDGWARKAH